MHFVIIYNKEKFASFLAGTIYGKLADIYGRKPILIIGTLIFLLGSAACAFSWDMFSLIVFRGLQGLGAGSIMASVNTIAGDIYTIEERAKIQGWLSSVWGVAAIMGPSIGGTIVEYFSWPWIFWINLPMGAASILLLYYFFDEKIEKTKHHIDIYGAVLMLITGTVLIFTLMQNGQSWPWLSWPSFILMSASVLLLFAVVRSQKRSPEPIMPIWVWKNKILLGSNLAVICMGIMMLGPNMYIPVYAQSVLSLSPIAAGMVLASMSVGWPLSSSFSGKLYLKIGFRNTALMGVGLIILSCIWFLYIDSSDHIAYLVANQFFLGAGFGLISTPTLVGVQSIVPWEKRGVVTGANMFSRYFGQSIGAAILAGVFNIIMVNQLRDVPSSIQSEIPQDVNLVIDALQSEETLPEAVQYLQAGFSAATHQVYFTMAIVGIITIFVLFLLPRIYPIIVEKKKEDET